MNEDEKAEILRRYGRKCFATGHEIPEGEEIQFDHIRAYATGGPTELDNIAPMCTRHNREKSTLPLDDFRVKLLLDEFFNSGDKLTLKHLLSFLQQRGDVARYGEPVSVTENGGVVKVEGAARTYEQTMYSCPTTGWKYFYATLDVEVLDSDDDEDQRIGLQPRYLIQSKVFDMFRHFQTHPVLQPSIGRVVDNRVRLFDGQHKAAALLLTGRREFECKVYLSPDLRLLNQTNISAHDKFAQTRFFSSIMILKLGSQFGADFEEYKNLEDGQPKSESGFMDYLARRDPTQTSGQLKQRFRSYLYSSVLEHEENRLGRLVSSSNRRSADKPITMDMLQKSLFSNFLYREPTHDNMATAAYRRDVEVENTVCLLNMFHDLALSEWNAKAGPTEYDAEAA
ncbi:MAG: HNH endonuclease [Planctomycetota bacterium]